MNDKHFKIKTVQNMIDCTNEANLDNFLTDLKALLTTAHTLRSMAELIVEIKELPKEMQEIKTNGYTWVDDNKHDAKITIGTK